MRSHPVMTPLLYQMPSQYKPTPTKTQGDKKNSATANQKAVFLESVPCISVFLLVCEQNALDSLGRDFCLGCREIKIGLFTAVKQAHDLKNS